MSSRHPYQPVQNSQWQVAEAKYLYDILLGKMLQPEPQTSHDRTVPYLRAANIQWMGVRTDDIANMYANPREIEACSVFPGDLLVCEGGEVGRAAVCPSTLPPETIIQNAVHRVRSKNGNSTRYLGYLLRHIANSGWFDVLCNKATIAHFTVEKFGDLLLSYPNPRIQELIADFLDRETTRLDSLVAEKSRLLDLLVEKRRALIARSITRGLNSGIPCRDSGIPWLGEIPAHWEAVRLKYLVSRIDQGWSPQCYSYPATEGNFGVLKTGCVNGGVFRESQNKTLPPEMVPPDGIEVAVGDILMSRASGSIALIGSVALITRQPAARLLLSDKIYRLLATDRCTHLFLTLAMGAQPLRAQIQATISGADGLANNIAKSDVCELWIPVPPKDEQQAITAHIQAETKKIDDFAKATQRTIALLQERRSALISAAVSGKLKIGMSTSEELTA